MSALKLVFAGTPAFVCPSLDAIAESNHDLVALYTQPDRPKGRGRAVQASEAKLWAEAHQVPVYQPQNFKHQADRDTLRALNPDVLVVIAYGLILPIEVLSIPRFGCINVHASLLPDWRGAAPIQYSILNGDTETGVSIMQMDEGMDTGPVLKTARCPIPPQTTAGELHNTLAKLATKPLIEVLNTLARTQTLTATPQQHAKATYASKITKTDAIIHWEKPAKAIEHQIYAFNPWPIARTEAGEHTLRVHQAKAQDTATDKAPGTILNISPEGIFVATGDGILQIESIQFAGGKVLKVADWLNAKKDTLKPGLVLK